MGRAGTLDPEQLPGVTIPVAALLGQGLAPRRTTLADTCHCQEPGDEAISRSVGGSGSLCGGAGVTLGIKVLKPENMSIMSTFGGG